jgi:hypothetical protein
MSAEIVLACTVELDHQLVQDTLANRTAMEIVRDWIGEYLNGDAQVQSWTPYWKEIQVRQDEDSVIALRFRPGGPVHVSGTQNWYYPQTEQEALSKALINLINELGKAMTQRRVADAIQSQYPDSSRQVRDDDSILLQFKAPHPTAPLKATPTGPIETAVIVHQNQTISVFAHCDDQATGRAAIRRLLANIQVAGIPLVTSSPSIQQRSPG